MNYRHKTIEFLKQQLDYPDENFVEFISKRVHDGSVTQAVIDRIRPIIQSALDKIVLDRIADRLGVSFSDKSFWDKTVNQPEIETEFSPEHYSELSRNFFRSDATFPGQLNSVYKDKDNRARVAQYRRALDNGDTDPIPKEITPGQEKKLKELEIEIPAHVTVIKKRNRSGNGLA